MSDNLTHIIRDSIEVLRERCSQNEELFMIEEWKLVKNFDMSHKLTVMSTNDTASASFSEWEWTESKIGQTNFIYETVSKLNFVLINLFKDQFPVDTWIKKLHTLKTELIKSKYIDYMLERSFIPYVDDLITSMHNGYVISDEKMDICNQLYRYAMGERLEHDDFTKLMEIRKKYDTTQQGA